MKCNQTQKPRMNTNGNNREDSRSPNGEYKVESAGLCEPVRIRVHSCPFVVSQLPASGFSRFQE
jgi:hypothetical protein